MSDEEPFIDVSDEIEALSDARAETALRRAARAIGISFDEALDNGRDNEELLDAFEEELKKMVIEDAFTELVAKGILEPDGVDPETGEIMHRVTDDGEEALRRYYGDKD